MAFESSLNRLQQQTISQRRPVSETGSRDREVVLLQSEIRNFQLRFSEIECGLVKLDERTRATGVGERSPSATKPTDPCRLSPLTPLRLSTRRDFL
jgi:hypothetical protein